MKQKLLVRQILWRRVETSYLVSAVVVPLAILAMTFMIMFKAATIFSLLLHL